MSQARLLGLTFLLMLSQAAHALPFAEGRVGGGYALLEGNKGAKSVSTATVSGAGRFGYQFDDSNYFLALDATAYRVYKASALGTNNDGNTLLMAFGHDWSWFTVWLAGGAGEMRSFDRVEEKTSPYRYYVTQAQLGSNFSFYRSDSASVELGITLGRITPDAEWRERYGLKAIDSLQMDLGFKLLSW